MRQPFVTKEDIDLCLDSQQRVALPGQGSQLDIDTENRHRVRELREIALYNFDVELRRL